MKPELIKLIITGSVVSIASIACSSFFLIKKIKAKVERKKLKTRLGLEKLSLFEVEIYLELNQSKSSDIEYLKCIHDKLIKMTREISSSLERLQNSDDYGTPPSEFIEEQSNNSGAPLSAFTPSQNNDQISDKCKEFFEKNEHLKFYCESLLHYQNGHINVRKIRLDIIKSAKGEIDFLVKVHALRQCFNLILTDPVIKSWFLDNIKEIMSTILIIDKKSSSCFDSAFDKIIEFSEDPKNQNDIMQELSEKGVVEFNAYDIFLDFILMDAFDDLENVPDTVKSVLNNRWMADSLKENVLSTFIFTFIKARSALLKNKNGFLSKFYCLSTTISPVLGWGFLGSKTSLKKICTEMKEKFCTFMNLLFDEKQSSYDSIENLSHDIIKYSKRLITEFKIYLTTLD